MSYVDEVIDLVVKKNPAEPEFHQAVKEVLESLRPVIEANEEKYRKEALLERLTEPENGFLFTSNTWFFVMLSLANLLLNSCFSTAPLKSAKSAV